MAQQQAVPDDIFSDLVPNKQSKGNGGAFSEDAVLMRSSFEGTRGSSSGKNNSMPGTPMVSLQALMHSFLVSLHC